MFVLFVLHLPTVNGKITVKNSYAPFNTSFVVEALMLFDKNVALGKQHSNVGSVGKNKQRRSEHSEAVRRGFQKT